VRKGNPQMIGKTRLVTSLFVLFGASACQFYARGPDDYRKDTRSLLETRSAQISSCYDTALAGDPKAGGTVVLHFQVAKETGAITDPKVLPESTAPAPLGNCIVEAIKDLKLDPSDKRVGDATFVWEFNKG
jgi:hypothetical protein